MPSFSSPARLTTLDAARGVAAYLVIIFHMRSYGHIKFETFTGFDFFSKGYLAVDFFFLLSGYVVAMSYEGKLLSGKMSFKNFALVRAIRLYPLYWLGTVFGIIGSFWLNPEITGDLYLLTLGFLGLPQVIIDPAVPPLYPFNGVAWSLGCEVFINIIWALALFRLPTRYLALICGLAAAAMIKAGLDFGSLMFGSFSEDLPGAITRVYVSFILGQILFRLMQKHRLPPMGVSSPTVLGILALALMAPVSGLGVTYDFVFVLLIAPLLVVAGAQVETGEKIQGFCHQLGRLSYALYVLHLPCIKLVNALWQPILNRPMTDTPVQGVIVTVSVVTFIAWMATELFDEPVRAILNARMKAKSAAALLPNRASA